MPGKITDPWLGFLQDVDRTLNQPVEVHCLGGFVLAVQWELPRPTGDVDFIEIEPSNARGEFLRIAGEGSEIARTQSMKCSGGNLCQPAGRRKPAFPRPCAGP